MAKQNVSPIERHVEKIVVGVCAAVLLAAAYLYFVQDPHTASAGGEELAPAEFYPLIRERSEQALRMLRDARPGSGEEEAAQPVLVASDAALRTLPKEVPVALAPPGFAVPDMPQGMGIEQVGLARILPPTKPVLTSGHAAAELPPTQTVDPGVTEPVSPPAGARQDALWVAASGVVERKKQREVFAAAKYMDRRQNLIIAAMEAERQERLPTGEWGAGQITRSYSPVRLTPKEEIELIDDGTGYRTTPETEQYLTYVRQRLETPERQRMIMRPDFQPLLVNAYAWATPPKLTLPDGTELDMVEFGVVFWDPDAQPKPQINRQERVERQPVARQPRFEGGGMMEGGGRGGRASRRGGGYDGGYRARPPEPAQDNTAVREAVELIRQAEAHIKKEELVEAEEILLEVSEGGTPMATRAKDLLGEHKEAIEAAKQAAINRELARQARLTLGMGQDIDPFWITDTTVQPGKTYRYRTRVVAVNQYAGMPTYMRNPRDAAKVLITGEWSEWSEPLEAKPSMRVFFTQAKEDTQTARLEVHTWSGGQWNSPETVELAIGQSVAASLRKPVDYNAIVSAIDFARTYRPRRVNKRDGSITYDEPRDTQAVTLAMLDGNVDERVAMRDIDAKRKHNEEKTTEKQQAEAPRPMFDQVMQGIQGPPPMGGPMMMDEPMYGPMRRGGGRFGEP